MSAKVVWYREAWWVRTHYHGKKRDRRIGTSKADKRRAEKIAEQINAKLTLGEFEPEDRPEAAPEPILFGTRAREWHRLYAVTFKPRFHETSLAILDNHLVPYFGDRDLREISEADLLEYIRLKLDAGQKPATILTALSVLRRVLNLAARDGLITRNPANGVGRLIARVARREDSEVAIIDAWTRREAEALLAVAEEHEGRFPPLLRFLLSTGARRSEALGLQWRDVDFERGQITIRRALTKGQLVTPKSGKSRVVALAPGLASALFDLFGKRRVEAMQRGWTEPPVWVFCSEAGTPLDERNVTRSWNRVRRRAQKLGVRPLKLHAARHTFATLALEAGRSIRFVAEQLGHANPALTLRVYAHAVPVEGGDLAFADFESAQDRAARGTDPIVDVSGRLYPSPARSTDPEHDSAPDASAWGRWEILERETGFEPATLTLAT